MPTGRDRLDEMNSNGMDLKFRFSGLLLFCLLVATSHCARGSEPLSAAAQELRRDELGFLIREAQAWVKGERERHRPKAQPLTEDEKRRLADFFPEDVIANARIRVVNGLENPAFFSAYEELGKPFPLDVSNAVGMALGDTVLLARSHGGVGTEARLSVLFHELVHLTQYRLHGIDGQLERYVKALAGNTFSYRANPYEDQAFDLQWRFDREPSRVFSVEDEVQQRFGDAP